MVRLGCEKMEDQEHVPIIVLITPTSTEVYRDGIQVACAIKHKASDISINPSSIIRLCPGHVSVSYKDRFEHSCIFSELYLNINCIGYVRKPIDESLNEYIKVVK